MVVDADGRELDMLGRQVPHRMNMVILGRAIPGLLGRFDRKVPAHYWQRGMDEASISCPCGANPCVAEGQIARCPCERFYLFADDVWVANSPAASPVGAS